ncbi:MAG TPA: Hsp20/alpha crystallin family protein, partial [Symbiobacteriaceae bacterium]|nr:Hsp20/alpha crystallin family protein [Symbiobacteriaceae bacterium]
PPVNLYVTDSHVVANVALPGLQAPSDLNVAVDSGRLRLRGRTPVHPLQGAAQAPLAEQVHGPFDRTVTLPVPVRGDTARSFYQNGLLEVWVERRSQA